MKPAKKPAKHDEPMNRSNAIKVILAVMPIVLGHEGYLKTSPEFQKQVLEGAQFIESLQSNSAMFSELAPIEGDPATEEDCARLRALRDAMNQALFVLCETCRPGDGTCPTP
jgi:predicted aldo/keto reductase-like oxidoreductase